MKLNPDITLDDVGHARTLLLQIRWRLSPCSETHRFDASLCVLGIGARGVHLGVHAGSSPSSQRRYEVASKKNRRAAILIRFACQLPAGRATEARHRRVACAALQS
jgi:hypothetical protein